MSISISPSPRHRGLSPAIIETAAGLSAGCAATLLLHPLDIIKTRLQVDSSSHPFLNSSRSVLHDVWRNEGPTRLAALYRGLGVNLVGNSAGWALYFLWYDQAKTAIRNRRGYKSSQELTNVDYLTASTASGVLSAVLTNPIWIVKTRMLSTAATDEGAYPGLYQGVKSILQKEGIRGCFHGLTPTLVGVSHGSLYFLAYEKLNRWRRNRNMTTGRGSELSNTDTIINTTLSKFFAGTITYPHQVLRARMQAQGSGSGKYQAQAHTGLIDLINRVWRNEGALGFYKGMFPNLLRVVPSACITFLVYENVKWSLPHLFGNDDEPVSHVSRP